MSGTKFYKDLDLTFTPHPLNGDLVNKFNEDAVKRSIRNIIMYGKGEKPFMPNFFSTLHELLFEPLQTSTAEGIKDRVKHLVQQYEQRAVIINIESTPDYDRGGYELVIQFYVVNTRIPSQVSVFLARVR